MNAQRRQTRSYKPSSSRRPVNHGTLRTGATVFRATVVNIAESGEVLVRLDGSPELIVPCDVLICGLPLHFELGDSVMVSAPETPDGNACILGIIKTSGAQTTVRLKHVEIDASESLSIRCGESSIDLRKDGKLMIRANDVLTKAKRTNRIKGGSVAIN